MAMSYSFSSALPFVIFVLASSIHARDQDSIARPGTAGLHTTYTDFPTLVRYDSVGMKLSTSDKEIGALQWPCSAALMQPASTEQS